MSLLLSRIKFAFLFLEKTSDMPQSVREEKLEIIVSQLTKCQVIQKIINRAEQELMKH